MVKTIDEIAVNSEGKAADYMAMANLAHLLSVELAAMIQGLAPMLMMTGNLENMMEVAEIARRGHDLSCFEHVEPPALDAVPEDITQTLKRLFGTDAA